VNYARAARPSTIEAVTVNVDPQETRGLQREWDARAIPVPLKVLDSPFRDHPADPRVHQEPAHGQPP
jgi:hypothetical protein